MRSLSWQNRVIAPHVSIVFFFKLTILFLLSINFGVSLSSDTNFIKENISNLIFENIKSDNNNVSQKQTNLPSTVFLLLDIY